MRKYYIEFDFESKVGNRYWFPLIIIAENNIEAESVYNSIENAIKMENKIIRMKKPVLVIDGINSDLVDEYIKNNLQGKIVSVNLMTWQFNELEMLPELNFDEHIDYATFNGNLSDKEIARTIAQNKFPIRLLIENDIKLKDILVLNVVNQRKE